MLCTLISLSLSALIEPHEEKSFVEWMRQTNQLFTGDEYQLRLSIFISNARFVREQNGAEGGFSVALNKLAALTPAEYRSMLGHRQTSNIKLEDGCRTVERADDDHFDWRDKGIVNPVKNQGQCGSCWAFSVVTAQESQWALKKNILLSLSEQSLMDCVTVCDGCGGGDEYIAYDYIIQNMGGLWNLESDYPYQAKQGTCKFSSKKQVSKVVGWYRPTTGDEGKLLSGLVSGGVVSVAMDASHNSFQLYSGGIYKEKRCSTTSLDHAVGLVGYGVEGSTPYWIVRNSYGADWGENGYIRIIRNAKNMCGIASDCVIPKVE